MSHSIKLILATCFIWLLLVLSSCHFNATFSGKDAQEKQAAEIVAAKLFRNMKDGAYDSSFVLFGKQFYKVTDTLALRALFEKTKQHLGLLQACKLSDWQTVQVVGTDSRKACNLLYKTKFERDSATIRLTLFDETGGSKIVSFRIFSEAFDKE